MPGYKLVVCCGRLYPYTLALYTKSSPNATRDSNFKYRMRQRHTPVVVMKKQAGSKKSASYLRSSSAYVHCPASQTPG